LVNIVDGQGTTVKALDKMLQWILLQNRALFDIKSFFTSTIAGQLRSAGEQSRGKEKPSIFSGL